MDHEWLSYSSCIWFTFSTFIGESVMRSVGSILNRNLYEEITKLLTVFHHFFAF